jgi:small-conductance mechanosensitive channel
MRISHLPNIITELHQLLVNRPELSAEIDKHFGVKLEVKKQIDQLFDKLQEDQKQIDQLETSSKEAVQQSRQLAKDLREASEKIEKLFEVFGEGDLQTDQLPKISGPSNSQLQFQKFLSEVTPHQAAIQKWGGGELFSQLESGLKTYSELRQQIVSQEKELGEESEELNKLLQDSEVKVLMIRDLVKRVG